MAKHFPAGKPHDNERRAIRFLTERLPNNYEVFTNLLLPTGRPGQTYEHDAVIVARHAIFAVEFKHWGGPVQAGRDRWILDDGTLVHSPFGLLRQKAQALKGLLTRGQRDLSDVWVQDLVFLTREDARPQVSPDFAPLVATYDDIIAALTDPRHFGLPDQALTLSHLKRIRPVLLDRQPVVRQAFPGIELIDRLSAPPEAPYQAWRGIRHGQPRTLHVYRFDGDTVAHRERQKAQALREVNLLERLRNGPDLLRFFDFEPVQDPEQAYVLSYEDTQPFLTLPDWLTRRRPGLSERLAVGERLTRALRWMHQREVAHRSLSPEAVLVSDAAAPTELRLCALELARDLSATLPTLTPRSLDDTARYAAPEYLRTRETTERSDAFSLGAVLFHLFNGRAPFAHPNDILRPFTLPPLHVEGEPLPLGLADALLGLLHPQPLERPPLDDVIAAFETARPTVAPRVPPLVPGLELKDRYRLDRHLHDGAAGQVWKARDLTEGTDVVLKIGDANDPILINESRCLRAIRHPHVVRSHTVEVLDHGRQALVVEYIDAVDGGFWAGAGDALDSTGITRFGRGFLAAVGALHAAGLLHRDLKPGNLLIREGERAGEPVLIDLGLAGPIGDATHLAIGTPAYKDPALYRDGAWGVRHDLFAAWCTFWEVLTGQHPFREVPEAGIAPDIDADDLPDGLPLALRTGLTDLVRRALNPDAGRRPASADEALFAFDEAIGQQRPPRRRAPTALPTLAVPLPLPDDLASDTRVENFEISVRAHRALATLGVTLAVDLLKVRREDLRLQTNCGWKTIAELMDLRDRVATRLGEDPPPVTGRPPAPPLFAPLVGSTLPLSELGRALTPALKAGLQGAVHTIGELCALSPLVLRGMRGVGAGRLDDLRRALAELAGEAPPPATLDALDALLQKLGKTHTALTHLFGLADGEPQTFDEVAQRMGVSRQRVHQLIELDTLARKSTPAHWVRDLVAQALPPAGFASLDATAGALEALLPREPGAQNPLSYLGFCRLGAALLVPPPRGNPAEKTLLAVRPPWQFGEVEALVETWRQRTAGRPILPWAQALEILREECPAHVADGDRAALLEALLPIADTYERAADEALFVPPVPFADALLHLKDRLAPDRTVAEAHAYFETWFKAVLEPVNPASELAAAGLELHAGRIRPLPREAPARPIEFAVDLDIAPQRLAPGQALDVRSLVAAARTGGFRVVSLPPEHHHRQSRELAATLGEALGSPVPFVDVDRVLIDALRAAGLWEDACFFEADARPDFSFAEEALIQALEAHLAPLMNRGRALVLGRPALLGTLGISHWISGLYERARGGRLGLIVLALPGALTDGRVRLNGRYPIPYTPDMAALVVRSAP